MTDPRDITLRFRNGLWEARIMVGGKLLDRSGGWHTREEARVGAIEKRDKLKADYAREHPELANATEPAKDPAKPGKSLRELAILEKDKNAKRQKLRSPNNYNSALNWLWEGLGKHADLPPKAQTKAPFTRTRECLLNSGLADRSIELYSKLLREVLHMLVPHGLNPAFIGELEKMPKMGVSEASGRPFNKQHFKIMFNTIDSQTEAQQLLFWIGASGGPQLIDTVFLPLWGVDWETGMVRYWRIKTGEKIEFGALPPLLKLLKARRERLGPDAVYAIPELTFTANERKDPKCNLEGWEVFEKWPKRDGMLKVPEDVVKYASATAGKAMNTFFKACGIKTKDITHKSFRQHNISFWASCGIKLKVRMRMAGHKLAKDHIRYDTASEREILRASEITWQYYQAIQQGKEFFVPSTALDLYEALLDHWKAFPDTLRAMVSEDLKGNFATLYEHMREAFDAAKAHLERQVADLKGFISEQFRNHGQVVKDEVKKVLDRLPPPDQSS